MARSAKEDPIEKFRFKVSVLNINLSITAAAETLSSLAQSATDSATIRSASKFIDLLVRAGFSSVTLPSVTMGEYSYRENIDNFRRIKSPGLASYSPVVLSRGVIGPPTEAFKSFFKPNGSRDLYEWFKLVHTESALLATANELTGDAKIHPRQNVNFRRDVVISVLDREGKTAKEWILFNAFPVNYVPGTNLDAMSNEKLIEELTLSYEFFIELEGGGVGAFLEESLRDAAEGAVQSALDPLPF